MKNAFMNSAKYFIYSIVSLLFLGESALADKMKVAFINPTYPNEPFWSLMTDVMAAGAKELDVELQILYSEKNRFKSLELVQQLMASDAKPDYLIFHFQAQIGVKILEATEQAGVYSLAINTNVPETDRSRIGQPRGKFKNWLGHIIPDDFHAGSLLASTLIELAVKDKRFAKDGLIHVVGLTGTGDNTASFERDLGINNVVNQRDDVVLHQIVNAAWDKDKAAQVTKVLMARYPETRVIWSASDMMALGAIAALKELGFQPGRDVLVGGVDGIKIGLDAIESGDLAATMSGHFIEGAWALLLLYDHYHGKDVLKDRGLVLHSKMGSIHAGNIESFKSKVNARFFEQLNFKSFSSVINPNTENLPLSFSNTFLPDYQR